MARTENERSLNRFILAQEEAYKRALAEIKAGKKTGHWMWFIFPQIQGLGYSETAKFYAIRDKQEAQEYLDHPILGSRLIEISTALLHLPVSDPVPVFGTVDSMKLKSSLTLFTLLENASPVFGEVLEKFFDGEKDDMTIRILGR